MLCSVACVRAVPFGFSGVVGSEKKEVNVMVGEKSSSSCNLGASVALSVGWWALCHSTHAGEQRQNNDMRVNVKHGPNRDVAYRLF